MNKKKNRSYIFILLLSALCFSSQLLFASRGILSHMQQKDSSSAHPLDTEKKPIPPAHPPAPHDAPISTPGKLPTPPDLSKKDPVPVATHNTEEKSTHEPKHPVIKTTKVGSVTIPVMPTPPPLDKDTLAGKVKVPKEQTHHDKKDKAPEDKKSDKTKMLTEAKHDKKDSPAKHHDTGKDKDKEHDEKHHDKDKHISHAQILQQEKDDQLVRFYFEDATLENLVRYIEELYNIKFYIDDDLNPLPHGGSALKGHKLTFTTNKPLTRPEAWSLFLKFLDMAGFAVVPGEGDSRATENIDPTKPHKKTRFYRITSLTNANREVLPTFFDTKLDVIPDNSTKVRYVFFVKNTPLGAIQEVVKSFSSSTAGPILTFPDLNALILTDKGSNIRSLMKIVKEFDKEMPEAMSVIKLKKSDAEDVAKLYQSLTQAEAPKGAARFSTQRNQPKSLYFPANARILPERRTNSLILLGPKAALAKIEEFIVKHVDVELDMPYSPLHIYELQYTQATNIAQILNSTATKFGGGTAAAQYGGVRDGNQYFGPMTITPDKSGNRLIIKAEENDYDKLKEIIKKLDVVQPQTIIEVLIVDVQTSDDKILGTQIRNKSTNSFVKNVDFQRTGMPTSIGSYGGVVNASDGSLLGNLISLASSAVSGSTVLSVGNNQSGIWGIMNILQQTSKTDIISNPFLLATNNYQASVTLGSTRNIVTSNVTTNGQTSQGFSQDHANLEVVITPQISSDGSIQMTIHISIDDYSSSDVSNGNKIKKTVNTAAIVQNREVLVLGGIIKNKVTQEVRKTPLLGDIPGLGWLFKSKLKTKTRSNVLIFISPQIIFPGMSDTADEYMKHKVQATSTMSQQSGCHDPTGKDPINKLFFGESGHDSTTQHMNDFMHQVNPEKKKEKKKKIAKLTRKPSIKRRRSRS
ncbi:MAG: general secretion pathway protein D [Alteromonas naphthalenivorans]|jgi:general secretion pathway protein D